jgi:hypothetical protein
MKKRLLITLLATFLLLMSNLSFGQAPNLGTAADFVLFSSNGAVSNTGLSQLTGNVGTNAGSSTAFGNVNGVMHDQDGASAQAATDLLQAYNELDTTTKTSDHSILLGNGDTLYAGVYALPAASTMSGILNLDAKGNSNAIFIFQIGGSFSTDPSSKVNLIHGALACHVYWKIEGVVEVAAGTSMKGTIIVNNAAINIHTGASLEGRALTTNGAITVDGVLAYTPIGCGSTVLTGPIAPVLASTECYAIFSSAGAVTNTGVTNVTGDVGTNVGSTVGFDPLLVKGTIHPSPDTSTAAAAADLLTVYDYLNTLSSDIELLYPAQFGNGLVLTPHTYLMGGAAQLTDTVFLNAQGVADAVFVIQIAGALSTATYANVSLMNGAKAKNVYWKIEGAVSIMDYSNFVGTVVSNNGAVGALSTGVVLDGRLLVHVGALTTAAATVIIPTLCASSGIHNVGITKDAVTIYPNPFSTSINITINDASQFNYREFKLYNVLGKEVMNSTITEQVTTLEMNNLPSGVYFYKVIGNNKTIQSGKLISQ